MTVHFTVLLINIHHHHHHHDRFTALFPGPPGVSQCQKRTSDFMVQGEINRGRHTDHPAGPTPSEITSAHLHHTPIVFTGQMPFLLPNQQYQTTEGNCTFGLRRRR